MEYPGSINIPKKSNGLDTIGSPSWCIPPMACISLLMDPSPLSDIVDSFAGSSFLFQYIIWGFVCWHLFPLSMSWLTLLTLAWNSANVDDSQFCFLSPDSLSWSSVYPFASEILPLVLQSTPDLLSRMECPLFLLDSLVLVTVTRSN